MVPKKPLPVKRGAVKKAVRATKRGKNSSVETSTQTKRFAVEGGENLVDVGKKTLWAAQQKERALKKILKRTKAKCGVVPAAKDPRISDQLWTVECEVAQLCREQKPETHK